MMAYRMPDPTLVVIGAGAMGGVFGGRLTEAGVPVTLLDVDAELVARLNRNGLRLLEGGDERTVPVHASDDPQAVGAADAVLFFVKCHQTAAAIARARPLFADGAGAVSLQNGWGNADLLARAYGGERVVVGVTYTSATVLEPGVVATPGPGRTVVGAHTGRGGDSLVNSVAEVIAAAGFEVERPADVHSEVWKKLVLNAATLPTAALTGLVAGELAGSEEMRALVEGAAAEAVTVGRALGFDVDLEERLESISQTLERAGSGKGSMLQDVEAGRPTEIDVISGAVLRLAEEHDVHVPISRALYALIKGLEHARGLR